MTDTTTHLFLNPTAGRGRAGKRLTHIQSLLRDGGVQLETSLSTHVGDLEARVRRCVEEGARRIVVAGGDGSIHEATNGILASGIDAALGVIPTGTGNDFAKACEIPLDWQHATQLLAARISDGQPPRRVDIGRCNDRYFSNGVGIGFDAKVNQFAHAIRWPIGNLVYLVAVFQAMLDGVITPRVAADGDGFAWQDRMTLINISNGPWVGGRFHIAPMASNNDGVLNLVLAAPVSCKRILALLPKLLSGKHLDAPDIQHCEVTQLELRADEPLPSHLDGEVQALQSHFDIRVLPGALAVI